MRQSEIREKFQRFTDNQPISQNLIAHITGICYRSLSEFKHDKIDLPDFQLRRLKKFMERFAGLVGEFAFVHAEKT